MRRIFSSVLLSVLSNSVACAYPAIELKADLEFSQRLGSGESGTTDQLMHAAHGTGYVRAVSEALAVARHACYPPDVTPQQMNAIVLKYIAANPEKWNRQAISLAATAISEAFPCPESSKH
jgi:hypothetical protein